MEMNVDVWKEGRFVIISSERYGVTTQGENFRGAIRNFQDAFITCFHDADWRAAHGISEEEYERLIKEESIKQKSQEVTSFRVCLSDAISKLVDDVSKTPNYFRPSTC